MKRKGKRTKPLVLQQYEVEESWKKNVNGKEGASSEVGVKSGKRIVEEGGGHS